MIAAQSRGNHDTAQQLLAEATDLIAASEESKRSSNFYALYIIAQAYGQMPDEQIKQTGFETISELAEYAIDPDLQPLINDMVVRTDAGLGPWL